MSEGAARGVDAYGDPLPPFALSRDGETLVTFAGHGEARWWSMSGARAPSTSAGAPHVVALRRLPGEGDRYAVMQPVAQGTNVLDLDARAFTMRPESWADTHQKWWGRGVEATLFRGKLALTNARGESRSLKVNSHLLAITPDDRYAVFLERSRLTAWDSTALLWSVDEAIAGYVPAPTKKKAARRRG